MRIARVLTRLNLGGPARQVLAADPLLVRRGHVVRVYTGVAEPGEGDLCDELRARGLDVVPVSGLARGVNPAKDLWALRALRAKLLEFRPELVHTHASKAGALGRRAAAALPFARTVHTFHGHVLEGYFPDIVAKRLIAEERRLAARTDRIVAVSHATADDLVRLGVVDAAKLSVVPPGIEMDELLALERPAPGGVAGAASSSDASRASRAWNATNATNATNASSSSNTANTASAASAHAAAQRAGMPGAAARVGPLRALLGAGPDAVLVGVVGRLAPVKRPELALELLQLLGARHPSFQLVFVGDGELFASLARRIRALDPALGARAHMLGARHDMPAVLTELDAVLLTSRSEGAPVCTIEAHAAALPVVAMDVGGVSEIVAHERTGFLGRTVDELAFGLDKLLADPRLRHACGLRGRTRVAARHSASALADRLETLYASALEAERCVS